MGKQGGKNTPVVTKPQYHGQKRKKIEDSDEEVDFPKKICRKSQKSIEINSSSDNEESDSEESEGPDDQVQDKSQGIEHKHLNSNRTKSIKQNINMNEYIRSESDDNNDDHSGKDTRDIDKSTKIDEYISSESDSNDDSDVTDDDEEDEEENDKLQEGTILKNVSSIKLHNMHRTTTKQFDSVMDQNDGNESLSSSYDDDSEDSSDDDNSIDIVDDGDHEAVKDELRKRSKLKEVITGKGHVTNSVETKDMQNINKPIIEESKSSSESESSDNEESDVGSDCQLPNKTQSGENENDRTKQFINKEIDEYISSESDDNSDSSDDDDDDDVTVDLKLPTSTKLKIVSKGDLIDSPVTKCLENMDKQLNTKHSSSADGMSSDSSDGDSEASEDQINDNNDVKGNSSIDDDEVETAENAEPEDDFAAVKKELANIPLEDLMKIKEKLGLKTFNRIMHGDKFEEKKQKVFKRENKNRPMELSSKKRVSVIRQGDVAKEKVSRDPRFDDLSGEFQDRHFMKNYSFLDDIKSKEKLLVQKKLNKTKDESKKKDLAKLLSKMNQQEQIEAKKKQKLELEQQWKEKERQLVKEGKAPYFLKKSEQKKLELAEKFKQLQKSGKVDQYMSKKLKKNAQKEKKKLPDRHQRFM